MTMRELLDDKINHKIKYTIYHIILMILALFIDIDLKLWKMMSKEQKIPEASGNKLDYIGLKYGIVRPYVEINEGNYYGFFNTHPTSANPQNKGFDLGIFRGIDTVGKTIPLPDNMFAKYLMTISQNRVKSYTINNYLTLVECITGVSDIELIKNGKEIELYFNDYEIKTFQAKQVVDFIPLPFGMQIKAIYDKDKNQVY